MKKSILLLGVLALAGPLAAQQTPEDLLKEARLMERAGKTSRATDLYRKFLQAHANHSQAVDAHFRLAQCLDALGLVDEVVPHLEFVIDPARKRYKQRKEAFYMLAKVHGSLKEYAKGAAVFEKLLEEGAGLYHDEALSLCGGYYALLTKYNEAAAKFNLLKRRESRFAEQAAYKLALLWIQAEQLVLAVDAVEDLVERFPQNKQAKGLMLQVAELFRRKRMFDRAAATCQQLRTRAPKSPEAQATGYILGLCLRDQKRHTKAITTLAETTKLSDNRKNGLAAEALLIVADIYHDDLKQADKAMDYYTETAALARDAGGERRTKILERCYFRLGEYYFKKKKWAVALENYVLLRKLNTDVNVWPRIMKCQGEVGGGFDDIIRSEADVKRLREKIKQAPGTIAAAEAEVFLLDRELNKILQGKSPAKHLVPKYADLLKRYPKEVLSQNFLESYIHLRMTSCYSFIEKKIEFQTASVIFDEALAASKDSPYLPEILEGYARLADAVGDDKKAYEVYSKLFKDTAAKVDAGENDATTRKNMSEYLRSMLTRADKAGAVDNAINVAVGIMNRSGPFSEAARDALFYIAELYYLKKDFSEAARTYKQFVKVHGPPQNAAGDMAAGPWRPKTIDDRTRQVYEAALRVAHCWYMQGHTQNMLKAYDWMNRNFPEKNPFVAEARYWLAMEMIKGKKGKDKEAQRRCAEKLWIEVVNFTLDFDDPQFKSKYHFWVINRLLGEDAIPYVKSAMLEVGQLYRRLGEHRRAARVFEECLRLFPGKLDTRRGVRRVDQTQSIARYALGQEYAAIEEIPKLLQCYQPYLNQMRDDKFRTDGLKLLAYHAFRNGHQREAIDAYATLLDEYGINPLNKIGDPIPIPGKDRIYQGSSGWNGIRKAPPKGLDLGETRFNLGLLYWKAEDWSQCVKALGAFLHDPLLFENRSRAKALFMAGQSYYRLHDYAKGARTLIGLVKDHPKFQAVDEVYVLAAKGSARVKKWQDVDYLCQRFLRERGGSLHRAHMDLWAAVSDLNQGRADKALRRLQSLADSDTYQDVKAHAYYYMGADHLAKGRPEAALKDLLKSIEIYAQENACLAAAKACMKLNRLQQAKDLLDRTIRDFPTGDRRTVAEATRLMPGLLKTMAKKL